MCFVRLLVIWFMDGSVTNVNLIMHLFSGVATSQPHGSVLVQLWLEKHISGCSVELRAASSL